MARSIVAGLTDYSSQTIAEMTTDLNDWESYLINVCELLRGKITELEASGYWTSVYGNFRYLILHAVDYIERSKDEIKEISKEIQNEIQQNHVSRLRKIGIKADELNRELGQMWNREYPDRLKDYNNNDFRKVETLYGKSRDAAANLLDLTNLASRLQDFIGWKRADEKEIDEFNKIVDLKPNFMGLGINVNAIIEKLFKRKKRK